MKKGMLWQAESGRPLAEEIKKAAEHYRQKYGKTPDTVELHPSMLEGQDLKGVKQAVHPTEHFQRGVLWIGADTA